MNEFRPGRPFPQGATWDGAGTNFSLFSENAERVELCLFDERGRRAAHRRLRPDGVPVARLRARVGPGSATATVCTARMTLSSGLRFNPAKLLIDPYAKAIDGAVDWRAANTLPYVPDGGEDADLELDEQRRRGRDPAQRRGRPAVRVGR